MRHRSSESSLMIIYHHFHYVSSVSSFIIAYHHFLSFIIIQSLIIIYHVFRQSCLFIMIYRDLLVVPHEAVPEVSIIF